MPHPALTSVLIDVHEPAWVQALTFGGIRSAADACPHLQIGDVWAGCSDDKLIVAERKTSDDLWNTIKDKRLLQECAALLTVSRYAYLVVTGRLYEDRNGYIVTDYGTTEGRWAAWQGAILELNDIGVSVVHFWRHSDYERAIIWLAQHDRDPLKLIPPIKHAVPLTPGETILASLPGIGTELAPRLLKHFGTADAAIAWLCDLDNAETFPGIAQGKKRAVREAMGLP